MELLGWSFEEVHAIVECIRRGQWGLFHEVMGCGWGGSTHQVTSSAIFEGNETIPSGDIAGPLDSTVNEDESAMETGMTEQEVSGAREVGPVDWELSVWSGCIAQLGQGWWMFVSGVFVWGLSCLLMVLGRFLDEGTRQCGLQFDFTDVHVTRPQGLFQGSCPGVAWLLMAWVFLRLHRVGALIAGSVQDPP